MASTVETIAVLLKSDGVEVRVGASDIAVFKGTDVPELVVEVLAPDQTRTDCMDKLRDYESRGVPEVWLVSMGARTVEVLLRKSGYFTTTALRRTGTLTPQRLPDVTVNIAVLFP
jgi:Uma2 family endonuclease